MTLSPPASPAPAELPPARGGAIRTATLVLLFALVLRSFLIEVHVVPTESMEPTIIGRGEAGDRLFVAKPLLRARVWQRFDLAVFRYPLSREVRFVKRIIGLPGEELTIESGDVWLLDKVSGRESIPQKPAALQREIFAQNPIIPREDTRSFDPQKFERHWSIGTGVDWRCEQGDLVIEAGEAPARVGLVTRLSPMRRDAYANTRNERRNDEALANTPIFDLRFEVLVQCESFELLLRDGREPEKPLRLLLRGASWQLQKGSELLLKGESSSDPRDFRRIALTHVDGIVYAEIDGVRLGSSPTGFPRSPRGQSQVSFTVMKDRAAIRELAIARDIYWLASPSGRDRDARLKLMIPSASYFMLGDNSAHSDDSRVWKAIAIRDRNSGVVRIGDLRGVSESDLAGIRDRSLLPATNPSLSKGPIRPGEDFDARADEDHEFLDLDGNRHRLAPGSWDLLDAKVLADGDPGRICSWQGQRYFPAENDPCVALSAVTTRALAGLSHGGLMMESYALPMPFVRAHDLIGSPIFCLRSLDENGDLRTFPELKRLY